MSTVLVTGGAGFIGGHLVRRLLDDGQRVVVLDSFDEFYSVATKRRNLNVATSEHPGSFEFVEGDFRDAATCAALAGRVDSVIHMAALAGVRPSIVDPVRYMDVNVVGTQTLLNAFRERPEVKIVFASSSSVYGGNVEVPFQESHCVDSPVSPYAASKKAGEGICYTHHHLHGNPLSCLRFFTVYGPGQRPEMAIHMFSRLLMSGQPIPMFGDGSTSRDYTYVGDIVDGIVAALHHAEGFHIYNLGGSKTTSLAELIAAIETVFGKQAKIDRRPEQPGDVRQTWADTGLAERDLGYRPQVELLDGLKRFATWYLAEREAGRLE